MKNWLHHYNWHRPHHGIGSVAPISRLNLAGYNLLTLHRPVIHDLYFFAAERTPDFPMTPEKVPTRLHIFFLEQYGIRVTAVRELLTAEIASEEDLKLLDLKHPAAVLSIEDVTFDQAGAPVVYSMRRASTENHMYINEIK